MQLFKFTTAMLLSASIARAENCTNLVAKKVFEPLEGDSNYSTCIHDTNVTAATSLAPWALQASAFCSSSACQTLLNDSVVLGILPHCKVVTSPHAFNLTDVVAALLAKCASVVEYVSLEERAVDKSDNHNKAGHVADNILHAIEHAIPMEEILL